MEWTPYTGPVVELDKPHYHAWILGEQTVPYYDGEPWTYLIYTATTRPYHNRMTARNRGRMVANPDYGGAGVMVLKCDANPKTCPTWTEHNAANRPVVEPETQGARLARIFVESGAKAILEPYLESGAKASLTPYHAVEEAGAKAVLAHDDPA